MTDTAWNICKGSKMPRYAKVTTGVLLVIAVCMHLSAVFIPKKIQSLLDEGIREAIVWKPDSPPAVQDRFRGSVEAAKQDVIGYYMFNITNVAEIRKGGKPKLQELGPYSYYFVRRKLFAEWDTEGKVSVKEWDYYLPVPELTVGSLDDRITTLNLPLIGVIEAVHKNVDSMYQKWIDLLVEVIAGFHDKHADGLFVTRTVKELIWGYQDPLLTRLSYVLPKGMIPTTRFELVHNVTTPEEALAQNVTVIDTGLKNISLVGNIENQNGFTQVLSWNNCTEKVQGTDATQFHPYIKRTDKLVAWVWQLYRSGVLIYKEDQQLHGIKLLRFEPDAKQGEPDSCHFQYIRGLMNVTAPAAAGAWGNAAAAVGPPILLSLPHFCQCDPVLAMNVEGVECNLTRHSTYADVEPNTGVTMNAQKGVMLSSQLTAAARQYVEPKITSSLIIPIFWGQEHGHVTKAQAHEFISTVYRAQHLAQLFQFVPHIVGAILLLSALGVLVLAPAKAKPQPPHSPEALCIPPAASGGLPVSVQPLSPPESQPLWHQRAPAEGLEDLAAPLLQSSQQ